MCRSLINFHYNHEHLVDSVVSFYNIAFYNVASFCLLLSYFKDSTFEFERKRNRPERYDRSLAENTLKAIKKIDKVRVDREARHHASRFFLSLLTLDSKRVICCFFLCCFYLS